MFYHLIRYLVPLLFPIFEVFAHNFSVSFEIFGQVSYQSHNFVCNFCQLPVLTLPTDWLKSVSVTADLPQKRPDWQ